MRAVELWSYRKALCVNAVTHGVRQDLIVKKSVPPDKILFLPNGADTVRFQPRPPDHALKAKLGLVGKKIILWAGTLGFAHGLENVLHAAKLLEAVSHIHFLFVGDGSAKSALVRLRDDMRLTNVTFRDSVSLDQLPPYFSIAEAGLSSLIDIPVYDGARPSKFFPVLASGKPLIFVGKGEAARLVLEAKAGVVVPSGNPAELARVLLELTQDEQLLQEYGQNGRRYVETHLQWSNVIAAWLRQLPGIHRQGVATDKSNSDNNTSASIL
jgi:glycosyltransferase involved in cell wall biosynthesis